jgi:23S rRNA (guanosine2251-2'-O)-methyltransferase
MPQRENTYIYGLHPVLEALRCGKGAVKHVYFVDTDRAQTVLTEVQKHGIPFDRCDEEHLPRGVERDINHQGVVALVAPGKVMHTYKAFMDELTVTPETCLVLLDELTDPHNVGAVIQRVLDIWPH